MRPRSAKRRRRRKVAAEARRRRVRGSKARESPTHTASARPSAIREDGASATGPRNRAVAGALTPRAHVGRGGRRSAIRIRRPVIRSVVRIAAMVSSIERVSGSRRRRRRDPVGSKHEGVTLVFVQDFQGDGSLGRERAPTTSAATCGRRRTLVRDEPLEHERPFVVKGFAERMFATNTRSCYSLLMSEARPRSLTEPIRRRNGPSGPVRRTRRTSFE